MEYEIILYTIIFSFYITIQIVKISEAFKAMKEVKTIFVKQLYIYAIRLKFSNIIISLLLYLLLVQ